jgi:anti-sigma regulatory factor (Ser/Thr protein kinase)
VGTTAPAVTNLSATIRAVTTPRGSERRAAVRPARRSLGVALLLSLVVASFLAATLLRQKENDTARDADQSLASSAAAILESQLSSVAAALKGAPAIVGDDRGPSTVAFTRFAADVLRGTTITAIALEQVVDDADRADFEASLGHGIVDRDASGSFVTAPERPRYCPVAAVYPDNPTTSAVLGFDVCADPDRADTVARAAASGELQMSDPVAAASSGEPAVFLVRSLSRPGVAASSDSTSPSSGSVVGFVSIGYLADDLLAPVLSSFPAGTKLWLSDRGTLLYGDVGEGPTVPLQLLGASWTVGASDGRGPLHDGSSLVLITGLALTALAAVLIWRTDRYEREVEQLSEARRLDAERLAVLAEENETLLADAEADGARALQVAELASALAGTRSPREVSDAALAVLRRQFGADSGFLAVVSPGGASMEVISGFGVDPLLAGAWGTIDMSKPSPARDAVVVGTSILASAGAIADRFPTLARWRELGVEWMIHQPVLFAGGLAVLGLAGTGREGLFADADLLSKDVAEVVGSALGRADLNEREQETARALQRGLLAVDTRSAAAVWSTRYEAAVGALAVGGDWYDVLSLPGERLGLVVGDAVGHGLSAAVVMAQLRSAVATGALLQGDPCEAIDVMERFASKAPAALCATVAVVSVDPGRSCLEYCMAGHLPPLLVVPGQPARFLDGGRSWPVMTLDRPRPTPAAGAEFPAGSLLLLYTDGLVERRGESIDDGLDRLQRLVERWWALPVEVLTARLFEDLSEPGVARRDDAAVVAFRTTGEHHDVLTATYAAQTASLPEARHRLAPWLAAQGYRDAALNDALVAVGEAMTNAVEHGSGGNPALRIRLEAGRVGEQVVVAVSDEGQWLPTTVEQSVRGRGLHLMRAMAGEVTIDRTEHGTTVVLELLSPPTG